MEKVDDSMLIHCIKTIYEVDVKQSDLNSPSQLFVTTIYTMFMKDFGVNVEGLDVIKYDAPVLMQNHPDFFRDTMFKINLSKAISYFLESITGVEDFYLKDLITPDPRRTRHFLSKFLYFYDSMNINLKLFEELDKGLQLEEQKLNSITDEIQICQSKIQERELDNDKCEEVYESVKSEIEMLSNGLAEITEKTSRYKGRLEGIKMENSELNITICETESQILENKKKINDLLQQTCDEKELQEIQTWDEKVKEAEVKICQLRESLKELEKDLKSSQNGYVLVNTAMQTLENIEEQEQIYNENETNTNDLKARLQDQIKNHEDELMRHQNLTTDLSELEEQNIHYQTQAAKSSKSQREEIERLQEVVKNFNDETESKRLELSHFQKACDVISENLRKIKQDDQDMSELISKKMSHLDSQIHKTLERKEKALKNLTEAI